MKKASFSVIKYGIIAIYVVLAVISAVLFTKVGINYNISDYLDEQTETKISLGIIEKEFGLTGTLNVGISGATKESATEVASRIKKIEGVVGVNFDPTDESNFKDGNALITVLIDGDDYSEKAKEVWDKIASELADVNGVSYFGGVATNYALRETITNEMVFILALSLALVSVILLITSGSWLEPIVLLIASGFAVILNAGTNIIFGEISYITNSVSAILQLALAVDYSIVLIHTYRAEKKEENDSAKAMLSAVKKVVKPVSASALTTIAGLIALLFMSFNIGFDIGIVLVKGIFFSAIASLTLLPALVLLLEKPMLKLKKKEFVPKGEFFCGLSVRHAKMIAPITIVLVIACGFLQTLNSFSFTETSAVTTASELGQSTTVLVLHKRGENDIQNEKVFENKLYAYANADGTSPIRTVTSYSNTVLEEYSVEKAAKTLNVSLTDAGMLFAMYALYGSPTLEVMTVAEFVDYTEALLKNDPDVAQMAPAEISSAIATMLDIRSIMSEERTAEEFYAVAQSLGGDMSLSSIEYIFDRLGKEKATGREVITYALELDKHYGWLINSKSEAQLNDMLTLDTLFADSGKYDYKSMTAKLIASLNDLQSVSVDAELSEDIVSGIFVKKAMENEVGLDKSISAKTLLEFVSSLANTNELLKLKLTPDMLSKLDAAKSEMSGAEKLFVGDEYARLMVSVDLPAEGEPTEAFVMYVSYLTKAVFGEGAYVAGEIVSTYDLKTSFDRDNTFISIFTVVSVFLIVMLIFRSAALPVILVAVIQGAIWIALSIWLAVGQPLFFMSYIMANCILMGATIDYGILMSNNYVMLRKSHNKLKALELSVNTAMPTVFSSGTVMTVCGFVIGAIASQRAVSRVGILIGIGTLVSVTMITVVLPSTLFLLDGIIMKLSFKRK